MGMQVKRSRKLDEMVRKVRAEALRIEAARLAAKRLVARRKEELAMLSQSHMLALAVPVKP